MPVWVDADACPKVIKEVLFRAAERTETPVILVANQPLRVPPSKFIRARQVPAVLTWRITKLCAAASQAIWWSRRIFRWRRK